MKYHSFYGLIMAVVLVVLVGGVLAPAIVSKPSLNANDGEGGQDSLQDKNLAFPQSFSEEKFSKSPTWRDLGGANPQNALSPTSNQAVHLEVVGAIGGTTEAVFAQGNYTYIGQGAKLLILDVTSPTTPTLLGSVWVGGLIYDINVTGIYAYVAADEVGLRVINVAQPTNPQEVGFYDSPGHAYGVSVVGSYAYLADEYSGLRVVDVSEPSNPQEVGFYDSPGYAYGVSVVGGYAYLAARDSGLRVVDVRQPNNPHEIGFYGTKGYAYGVNVVGSTAYLADGNHGLMVVDVSEPSNPQVVASYFTPGHTYGVSVVGSTAYLADGSRGLKVVDVSEPSNAQEVGFYDSPGVAYGVSVVGSTVYLADGFGGLRVVDVSEPSNAQEVGFYSSSGNATEISVVGSYTYLADWGEGLRVVDVSEPSNPEEVGFYDSPGDVYEVSVVGNYAHLAAWSEGLRVVDISEPNNPHEIGYYDSPGYAGGVSVVGNTAYLAAGPSGLRVVDVSEPNNLQEVGFFDSSGWAYGVSVAENYVYLADGYSGLKVLDVSELNNLQRIGFFDSLGDAKKVSVVGNYAYLADEVGGLRVLDVSEPSNLQEIGFYDSPGYAEGVSVVGNYAYLVAGSGGLRVLDVSKPSNPQEIGFYDTPGYAYGVNVVNDYVYLANGAGGLLILHQKFVNLAMAKTGPQQIIFGTPITYTLNITNTGNFSATNLFITDTLPSGINYLNGGGTLFNNQAQWHLDYLSPFSITHLSLVVIPTTNLSCTITNQHYGLVADKGIAITGQPPVVTTLSDGQAGQIYVLDENQQPLTNTLLFQNGTLAKNQSGEIALPNPQGLITTTPLYCTDQLVALQPVYEQSTLRQAHNPDGGDNFAYRVYLSSMGVDNAGNVTGYTVPSSTHQTHTLTIKPENTLILFNIIASLEWDATAEELATMQQAFRLASDYLYDVSDGQMAFGWVSIYDNAEHWADADFQFSVKNTVRPYAYVGSITSEEDTSRAIRVGRFWDGRTGNAGAWTEPNGYRTLIHEFGHYALYLYDEYFLREVDEYGNILNENIAACTSQSIRTNETDETNGSMMYYQYNASELVDTLRWNEDCQNTEQHRHHNQADWQTVLQYYSPPQGVATPWILQTPDSRGSVVAGPSTFPTKLLNLPTYTLNNTGMISGSSRSLTVILPNGQPAPYVLVSLYSQANGPIVVIDQGITDMNGHITIYGANTGDVVRVATFDSAHAASKIIDDSPNYIIYLQGTRKTTAAEATTETPYLLTAPNSTGNSLDLMVKGLAETGDVLTALIQPNKESSTINETFLTYNTQQQAYTGQANVNSIGPGSGRLRIVSSHLESDIRIDYRLQQTTPNTETILYSEDGNFQLHLPPNSTGDGIAHYTTIAPTGYVPGSIAEHWTVLGAAYNIKFSGGIVTLPTTATLKMHIPAESTYSITNTAIYRWSDANQDGIARWHKLGGTPAPNIENALVIPVNKGGIYALINVIPIEIYLPLIIK